MAKITSPIHVDRLYADSNVWNVWADKKVIEQIRALDGVVNATWYEPGGYWYVRVNPRYDLQALQGEMLDLAQQDQQAEA